MEKIRFYKTDKGRILVRNSYDINIPYSFIAATPTNKTIYHDYGYNFSLENQITDYNSLDIDHLPKRIKEYIKTQLNND